MIEQGRRLKAARLAAGFRSGRAAAVEAEWAESTYSSHEGGRRQIGQDDAERYARFFRASGVTASGILFGQQSGITAQSPNEISSSLHELSWGRLAPMIDAAIRSILSAIPQRVRLSPDLCRLVAAAGVQSVLEALEEPPSQIVELNQADVDQERVESLVRRAARKGFQDQIDGGA